MNRSSAPHFGTYCSWDLQPSPGSNCDEANDGQVRRTEGGHGVYRVARGGGVRAREGPGGCSAYEGRVWVLVAAALGSPRVSVCCLVLGRRARVG
ncbi:hypothetical protein ES332_D04G211400v1 [Gossypium tomentosum]|uniref:Uncharacterized protein n=1 Tax=Gossypium tomentosum TaxID=34277 RepID=A0A5D2LGC9_GOSTO|nr:hypothetical protein ES332_D04G211400v1 [Gossypium tomentosum]